MQQQLASREILRAAAQNAASGQQSYKAEMLRHMTGMPKVGDLVRSAINTSVDSTLREPTGV